MCYESFQNMFLIAASVLEPIHQIRVSRTIVTGFLCDKGKIKEGAKSRPGPDAQTHLGLGQAQMRLGLAQGLSLAF